MSRFPLKFIFLSRLFPSLLLFLLLSSCASEMPPESDGSHRFHRSDKGKIHRVALSLGGDYVLDSEEPLMRGDSEVPAHKYVGINVTRLENGKKEDERQRYAYGLFEDLDNIEIDLYSGFTYDFEVSLLRDGTDIYYPQSLGYLDPFKIKDGYATSTPGSFPSRSLQDFQYQFDKDIFPEEVKKDYLCQLWCGSSWVKVPYSLSNGMRQGLYSFPKVHRFYGTLKSFDPAQSNEVKIDMKYRCFGLKIELASMPAGTTLTVKDISDDPEVNEEFGDYLLFPPELVFSSDEDGIHEWEEIFSFNDLTASTPKAFQLQFTWKKADLTSETFISNVIIHPNTKKILRINIDGNPNTVTRGNLILQMESENLIDDVKDEYFSS